MNRGTQAIGVGLLLVATQGVVETEAQDPEKVGASAPVATARRTTEAIRVDGRKPLQRIGLARQGRLRARRRRRGKYQQYTYGEERAVHEHL